MDTVVFRDPLFFAYGPYSAAIQAGSRPFSMHLHMHPLTSLVIILDVASAMYGIPVLIISLCGIITFLYVNRNSGTLSFSLLTVGMLLTPILTDYIAMIEGSGEIYPVGNNEWFNGRYLIFVAPFLAFGSTSIIFFADKAIRARRSGTAASNLLSAAMIAIIIISYSMIFVTQPFVVGKTIAMADTSLLPFQKGNQFTSETGKIMGNLYYGGVGGGKKILLLTPNQVGQQIMFASNLPIRTFIDVEAGHYWSTSIVSPWSYGNYLVLEKPIHTLAYEKTTYDPALKIISYWQSNEGVLLKYYRNTYENQYFEILIRK